MKHTTKMIKIPLDQYRQLISKQNFGEKILHSSPRSSSFSNNNNNKLEDVEPMERARENISKISAEKGGPGSLGEVEKWLRLAQEVKRYQKLARDREDRPMSVRVKNLSDILGELPPPSAAEPRRERSRHHAHHRFPSSFDSEFSHSSAPPPSTSSHLNESILDEEVEEQQQQDPLAEEGDDDGDGRDDDDGREEGENISLSYRQAMDYVRANTKALGLNPRLKILQTVKGRQVPMKTGDVGHIIRWHLGLARTGGRRQPTGYKRFMANAKAHPYLRERLFSASSSSSSQSSSSSTIRGDQGGKGVAHHHQFTRFSRKNIKPSEGLNFTKFSSSLSSSNKKKRQFFQPKLWTKNWKKR